jgi:RhtB (resistance to homoserine/threonine) family protein
MIEFLTINSIIILAAISPGPDFAIVVKNSLLSGRKAGVFTALGVSCSLIIHSIYSILGLAIIISQSLLLFSIVKYIGAAYLIFIGIKSLLAKRSSTDSIELTNKFKTNIYQSFIQGALCNLLNPKAIMFILAFFTLIIKPSNSFVIQFSYGIEIALIHLLWFSCLAFLITQQNVKKGLNRIQHYVVKVMGIALIGFGARIASLSHTMG